MTRMQQRKWRRPALGIALLGLILAFVVWDRCGMHWLEPPWKPVPASAPPGFRASFSLNRTIYSLGEPIVGTLAIVNTGDRPVELDTGGDGRAGRPERFRFQALDPHGKPLPDLLQILSGSLPQGGLGGGVTLQPHEEYRVAVLLNLFVNPREPGIYRIDGTYQSRAGRFAWSGATVKVRRWTGHMNRHEAGRLFVRSGLGGIHPCLVYGLENRTSRIGELIRMAVQRPAAGNSPKSPAERNAAVCAMQALVLMPDKAAVFHALEQEIAARSKAKPDPGRDDSRLELIYQCAATPESVGLVERSLDHPDPAVAALALRTALTMGSAKALQRLPAALDSRDDLARGLAVESAFKYLTYAQGNPALRIEGLSAALAPQYEQALLEGFRRDELGSGAPMPEIILVRYLDAFNATGGRVWDAIGIAAQSPSALKHRALLRFLTTMSGYIRPNPPLDAGRVAQLMPFLREYMKDTNPDPDARAMAIHCLGYWEDRESAPAIEPLLGSDHPAIRLSAAEALLMMRDRPFMDRAIQVLCDGEPIQNPQRILLVAGRLGMNDPWKAFGNDGVGKPGTASAAQAIRENRKAQLRSLAAAAAQ